MKIKQILFYSLLTALTACSTRYTLVDQSGRDLSVSDISFDNSDVIRGIIGRSEVTLSLDDIQKIEINREYKQVYKGAIYYSAVVTFKDNQTPEAGAFYAIEAQSLKTDTITPPPPSKLYIAIAPMVTGETDVGSITLPLTSIQSIELYKEPEAEPEAEESLTETVPAVELTEEPAAESQEDPQAQT